jgi:hypothetical protein
VTLYNVAVLSILFWRFDSNFYHFLNDYIINL